MYKEYILFMSYQNGIAESFLIVKNNDLYQSARIQFRWFAELSIYDISL